MRPGIEDLSQFSWRSPSCRQVYSPIWLLLDDGVILGLSWSRGSLLKISLKSSEGIICDGD